VTEREAMGVYQAVSALQPWGDSTQKCAVWVQILVSPQQADVSAAAAHRALVDLAAEIEPGRLSPAMVLSRARGTAKAVAPSTWTTMEERLQLEAPGWDGKRRQHLAVQDRAALARLAEAFAKRGEQLGFDHLCTTMREKCGVVFELPQEETNDPTIPF